MPNQGAKQSAGAPISHADKDQGEQRLVKCPNCEKSHYEPSAPSPEVGNEPRASQPYDLAADFDGCVCDYRPRRWCRTHEACRRVSGVKERRKHKETLLPSTIFTNKSYAIRGEQAIHNDRRTNVADRREP